MKIKYYGTSAGSGVPEPFCSCRVCAYARAHGGKDIRTRSQATIDDIMIDCPIDLLAHTVFYGLDMRAYRHIFITHEHGDHYARGEMSSRYTDEKGWDVYLPPITAQKERERTEAAAAKQTKTPPQRFPRVHAVTPFEPLRVADYTITALPARHSPGLEAVLYLVEHAGKTALWIHDSGLLLPETVDYLAHIPTHLDFVSMDCTLKRASNFTPAHMDITQCAQTKALLCALGRADERTVFALSHIGHLVERTHAELQNEAAELGFIAAYDTMELTV